MVRLVFNSVVFAALSASLAALWGAVGFVALAGRTRRQRARWLAAAVAALLMPAFLLAGSWLDLILQWFPGGPANPLESSLVFAAWVVSLQFWPLTTLLLLAMAERVDPSLLESARLSLSKTAVWTRVALPMLAPGLGLAWLATFILALNNFIVPTTFQTPVQITEIFVDFSSRYDTSAALLQSLPILAISLTALLLANRLTCQTGAEKSNRLAIRAGHHAFERIVPPAGPTLWSILFVGLLLLSLLPPVSRIVSAISTGDSLATLRLALPQLKHSIFYASTAALLATVAGLGAWWLIQTHRRFAPVEWLLLAPFVLSGFFIGIALIAAGGAWRLTCPLLVAVGALGIRFAWLPFKAAAAAQNLLHPDLLDAAKVFRLSHPSILRHVQWPALRPAVLHATWLVYLLALWDVETLCLLYPAGGEPVSLRIFQLLHYGYDSQVAVLSLALIALGVFPLLFRNLATGRERSNPPTAS